MIYMGIALSIFLVLMALTLFLEQITLLLFIKFLIVSLISLVSSTVFHEMGHYLGGILSGYRFGFVRIGFLALCHGQEEEDENPFVIRKYRRTHSLSECFMIPPRGVPYDEVSYKRYLLGGGVFNLLTIPAALAFLIPFGNSFEAWLTILLFSFVALIFSLLSLIPLSVGNVPNDGYTSKLCSYSSDSHFAFVSNGCIEGAFLNGQSIGDMPQPWFYGKFSLSKTMTNDYLQAKLWLYTADRFLIQTELFQAKIIYEAAGNNQDLYPLLRLKGLYKQLYAMLLEARVEQVKIYDIPFFIQKQEKKLEKYHLCFSRYRFGYAKLVSDSTRRRNEALHHFERVAETTPYHGEVEDERILLERLDDVELHYGLWGV